MKVTEVLLDDDAKEYINKGSKENSILVKMVNVGSSWCPQLQPSVEMGKPKNKNKFKLIEIDGINVYLERDMEYRENKIKISIGKVLWKKHLKIVDSNS